MSVTKMPSVLLYAAGLLRCHAPGCMAHMPYGGWCVDGCETDDQVKERIMLILEEAE